MRSRRLIGSRNPLGYNRAMSESIEAFQRSIKRQIALNQARTPSERLNALCELLDAARSMAPTGPDAQRRRRLANEAALRDKEQWRERCRQFLAAKRTDA